MPNPHDVSASGPESRSVLFPDADEQAHAAPIEPGKAPPNLRATAAAVRGAVGRSAGVTIIAVLALLYSLYFARDFLLPIVIAVLLSLLFSPVVRALTRVGIAAPIGAAVVILSLLGLVGLGAYELSGPVQRWVANAPQTVATAESRLRRVLTPFERFRRTAEQVEDATSGAAQAREVVVRGPTIMERVFGTTQRFVAGAIQVVILLYFLLAAGDLFLQKLIKVLPQFEDKRTAVQIARKTESSISTYLLTATGMNVGEGIVVALALWMLGMPNPALWGALVVVLEFIPYLGAWLMTAILGAAGLASFDSLGHALLVPTTYVVINLLQANVLAPVLFSRRLTLNPVAVFVGLAFWWWIWGIPGAFVAVPLMATFKIFCDHIEVLAPIGEFLGQRDEGERRETVRALEG